MFGLPDLFKKSISKEEIAKLLNTNPAALEAFEKAYATQALNTESDNFFDMNSRMAAEENRGFGGQTFIGDKTFHENFDNLVDKIVNELLAQTTIYKHTHRHDSTHHALNYIGEQPVTLDDIKQLPEEIQPQLSGTLMKKDIGGAPSYVALLDIYKMMMKESNPKKKQGLYHHFRQGLDILDLDPVLYEMIGTNPNSMGYWLPKMAKAVESHDFFKIPETTIIKVPLTLLQLTRIEYQSLTRTTLDIVDKFCYKAFGLDTNKDYFIKTGTYSSKFDFRNARVTSAQEVRELGEYLLFIHFQAQMMASPLSQPSIYGVSTTNEWVVREFIEDKENNPCIYKGMPLHTEYRVFVDFDTKKVIGINPYWDPNVMKQRFGHEDDADSPHNIHDYIIYTAHEEKLMQRYNDNKDTIIEQVEKFLPDVDGLTGQWSIDIMQNGEDFWFIDMALAQNSALIDCVPVELRTTVEENWLPDLSNK